MASQYSFSWDNRVPVDPRVAERTSPVHYRLLTAFEKTFSGTQYNHRNQTLGDFIASHLYEDLLALGRSKTFVERVRSELDVVNVPQRIVGRNFRRGDGTFGELVPGEVAVVQPGFEVRRGPLATLRIGIESKILATAIGKQQDRVTSDLNNQASRFHHAASDSIRVALVGVNFADSYTAYEAGRPTVAQVAPSKQALKAIDYVERKVRNDPTVTHKYDEIVYLKFKATNVLPYPFVWVDEDGLKREYSAALVRISNLFESRFG